MDETYADFVLNATAAMEQRSRGTPMEHKLHFVSNVVLSTRTTPTRSSTAYYISMVPIFRHFWGLPMGAP